MSLSIRTPRRKTHSARNILASIALLSLWFVTAGTSSARAFWFGTVPSDGVELKASASPSSATVQTLAQGMRFSAVDEPTNGYYRIRTKSGSGFIDATLVESQKTIPGGAAAPTQPAQTSTAQANRPQKKPARKPSKSMKWSVRLLLGSTLSNPSDVSNMLGSTSLADPLSIGIEAEYKIDPEWRLAFRIESLSKSVTGPDSTTGNTYDVSISALTVMIGADYIFDETPKYILFGGVRAGLGKASLSSVATNLATPNETDFSGSSLAGLLLVGADYKAWTRITVGGEAGYRVLSTAEAGPTTTGAGSGIWTAPIGLAFTGVYVAIDVRVLF
jgi:opacity protein-like surface antigen